MFVDNNRSLYGGEIEGIPILSFNELLRIKDDVKIIFATNLEIYSILMNQIDSYGIDSFYAPQQYAIYNTNEIEDPHGCIISRLEDYRAVYNLLEDDLSKKTLDNHLMFRCNYDRKVLLDDVRKPTVEQYFDDDIYRISSENSFVDCGAYTGDILDAVFKRTGGVIKNYYAFEPDYGNFCVLRDKNTLNYI